jgi:hypothetical protein
MNMDVLDAFPFNQYGQLVSRKKYVNTTVRNYENALSATMDLTIEEVTSAANERYALLHVGIQSVIESRRSNRASGIFRALRA